MNNNTNTRNTWKGLKAWALREDRPSRRERIQTEEGNTYIPSLAEIMKNRMNKASVKLEKNWCTSSAVNRMIDIYAA